MKLRANLLVLAATPLLAASSAALAYCPVGYNFLGDDTGKGRIATKYCGKPVSETCTQLYVSGPLSASGGMDSRSAVVRTADVKKVLASHNYALVDGYTDPKCPHTEETHQVAGDVFPYFSLPGIPMIR